MVATKEKFVTASKSGLEAFVTVAQTAFASTERLAALNLSTARTLMDSSVANIHAVMGMKNPQEMVSFQKGLMMPAINAAVEYSRAVYEIASGTQAVLGQFFENKAIEIKGQVESSIEGALKSAPVGSDAALSAFKSVTDSANTAYASLKSATQKAVEMTEANVKQATDATLKSIKAAA